MLMGASRRGCCLLVVMLLIEAIFSTPSPLDTEGKTNKDSDDSSKGSYGSEDDINDQVRHFAFSSSYGNNKGENGRTKKENGPKR